MRKDILPAMASLCLFVKPKLENPLILKTMSRITLLFITLFIGLAAFFACFLPGINEDLLGPHRLMAYVQSYILFVIPNLFFYGVIICCYLDFIGL